MEVLPQNSLRTERDRGSVKKVLASLLQPSFPFPGRYGFSGIRRNRWSSSWCSERLFFRYCEYWTRSCGFRKQQHQERNQKATTSTAESESNNINSGIRKQQHQQRNQKATTSTAESESTNNNGNNNNSNNSSSSGTWSTKRRVLW